MSLWDMALLEHYTCDSITEEWTIGMFEQIKIGKFTPNRVSALIISSILNGDETKKSEIEMLKEVIQNYADWSIVRMHYVENRMSPKEILEGYREKKRREDIMDELKP
jgi:hypothetical protein